MRHIFCSVAAAFILAACSSNSPEPVDRPGGGTQRPEENAPDYSYIMDSRAIRFECDTLTLNYEDGGVLYSVENGRHRLIELSSGRNVTFCPADTSLTINGIPTDIRSLSLIATADGLDFHVLLPGPIFLVTESPCTP